VLVEKDRAQRLYFVVETKSSLFTDDVPDREGRILLGQRKRGCTRVHHGEGR